MMVSWNDFYNSTSIDYSSNSDRITAIPNKFYLRFAKFSDVQNAIRVESSNNIESLISECIFSGCYSDKDCGVLYYNLKQGCIIIHKVCSYNCHSNSNDGRSFGYCRADSFNQLNFSSFLLCPSNAYTNKPFGSITVVFGLQVGNNINSSYNYASTEGCIIFDDQKVGSRISYIICADCHSTDDRSFFVGHNVLVFSSTIIRCSSKANLIHFSGPGEITGCNIISCQSQYSIGCASGMSKAYDIFISNNLPIDKESVIMIRQVIETAAHPHQVLRTFHCWDGELFKKSECHQRNVLLSLLLTFTNAQILSH